MKQRQSIERKSLFWSRLLGLMIAVAIVTLLVVGGVKNLMGELSTVYGALSASESELAVAQERLAASRAALTEAQAELDMTHQAIESQSRALHLSRRALDAASEQIQGLTAERDDLKRGLGEAVSALVQSDRALAASRDQLNRYLQQPKLSVVVTSERQFAMSQRESFAASRVRMFAEGDGGMMYYDGAEAFYESEQHVAYTERTQVVLTQTGPGDDVFRCLQDGCAVILAAQQSAMQMESYAYQSEYVSSEMLLVDGRRGRRPGRRR